MKHIAKLLFFLLSVSVCSSRADDTKSSDIISKLYQITEETCIAYPSDDETDDEIAQAYAQILGWFNDKKLNPLYPGFDPLLFGIFFMHTVVDLLQEKAHCCMKDFALMPLDLDIEHSPCMFCKKKMHNKYECLASHYKKIVYTLLSHLVSLALCQDTTSKPPIIAEFNDKLSQCQARSITPPPSSPEPLVKSFSALDVNGKRNGKRKYNERKKKKRTYKKFIQETNLNYVYVPKHKIKKFMNVDITKTDGKYSQPFYP